MGYHDVQILCLSVKLDGITTLFVAVGAVFFIFVLPLLGVILGLFLDFSDFFGNFRDISEII